MSMKYQEHAAQILERLTRDRYIETAEMSFGRDAHGDVYKVNFQVVHNGRAARFAVSRTLLEQTSDPETLVANITENVMTHLRAAIKKEEAQK